MKNFFKVKVCATYRFSYAMRHNDVRGRVGIIVMMLKDEKSYRTLKFMFCHSPSVQLNISRNCNRHVINKVNQMAKTKKIKNVQLSLFLLLKCNFFR